MLPLVNWYFVVIIYALVFCVCQQSYNSVCACGVPAVGGLRARERAGKR